MGKKNCEKCDRNINYFFRAIYARDRETRSLSPATSSRNSLRVVGLNFFFHNHKSLLNPIKFYLCFPNGPRKNQVVAIDVDFGPSSKKKSLNFSKEAARSSLDDFTFI